MRISDWSSDVCSSDLLAQFAAFFVEQVEGRLLTRAQGDLAPLAARRFLLDQAQRAEPGGTGGADEAGALAMRAGAGRGFEDAGPQPLAAHLPQAKAGDAAHLDAGAVVLQRVLPRPPDLGEVRSVIHVDEVEDRKSTRMKSSH